MLLEAGEAHSGGVAVGDVEVGGDGVPVNLVGVWLVSNERTEDMDRRKRMEAGQWKEGRMEEGEDGRRGKVGDGRGERWKR